MFKSGEFVAKHLEPHDGDELDDKQIQPNGVDLRIDEILSHGRSVNRANSVVDSEPDVEDKYGHVAFMGDEDYKKTERREVGKVETSELDDEVKQYIDSEHAYRLEPGGYILVYQEEILEIPEDHVGLVWPRSRFLRVGSHLVSAVWDTGYSGRGEGALITTAPMYIGEDMRVGQMVFSEASHYHSYGGTHQGERVEE